MTASTLHIKQTIGESVLRQFAAHCRRASGKLAHFSQEIGLHPDVGRRSGLAQAGCCGPCRPPNRSTPSQRFRVMSPRPLHIVASARPAMVRAQMSRPNAFAPAGGRGRVVPLRPETGRVAGDVSRDEFLRWWSGLVMRRCGSARAVAQQFGTTEQTGRNWIDGFACPTGLQVMRAAEWWPGDFAGAGLAMRRPELRGAR